MASYIVATEAFMPTLNLSTAFALLAALITIAFYIPSKVYARHKSTDQNGNRIPSGPIGLPVVGTPHVALSLLCT